MNKQDMLNILESEYKRHTVEIKKHKKFLDKTESGRQFRELIKHYNKRNAIEKVINLTGFEVCEDCGGIK